MVAIRAVGRRAVAAAKEVVVVRVAVSRVAVRVVAVRAAVRAVAAREALPAVRPSGAPLLTCAPSPA